MSSYDDINAVLENFGKRLGLPQPTPAERAAAVADMRKRLDRLTGGGDSGPSYGLLGPTEEQLATLRQERGIPTAEAPSPMVSFGRGAMDLWEPVKQTYLNATDPTEGQAYRQHRAENERLYQRGLLSANPQEGFVPSRDDTWRTQGQQIPLMLGATKAPTMALPPSVLSFTTTQNVYDSLNALRKRFGIGE